MDNEIASKYKHTFNKNMACARDEARKYKKEIGQIY